MLNLRIGVYLERIQEVEVPVRYLTPCCIPAPLGPRLLPSWMSLIQALVPAATPRWPYGHLIRSIAVYSPWNTLNTWAILSLSATHSNGPEFWVFPFSLSFWAHSPSYERINQYNQQIWFVSCKAPKPRGASEFRVSSWRQRFPPTSREIIPALASAESLGSETSGLD